MIKISKKTALASFIALLVLAGTNFLTYSLVHQSYRAVHKIDDSNAINITSTLSSIASQNDATLIKDLVDSPDNFLNKTLTIVGILSKTPEDLTLAVQPGDKPAAQELDISSLKSEEIIFDNLYEIRGKLIIDENNRSIFKVDSIEKAN